MERFLEAMLLSIALQLQQNRSGELCTSFSRVSVCRTIPSRSSILMKHCLKTNHRTHTSPSNAHMEMTVCAPIFLTIPDGVNTDVLVSLHALFSLLMRYASTSSCNLLVRISRHLLRR